MKYIIKLLYSILFLLFFINLAFATSVEMLKSKNNYNCTIYDTGIGYIKFGMTLEEAKKEYPKANFVRSSDADGAPFVDINMDKDNLMSLNANEDDPDKAINWRNKIVYMETSNSACKTANGIYPGILVKDAEKILGKITEITVSEIESREYIHFQNQSKKFTFLLYRPDNTTNLEQGTTHYPDGSIIATISVSENE